MVLLLEWVLLLGGGVLSEKIRYRQEAQVLLYLFRRTNALCPSFPFPCVEYLKLLSV